ncbi:MAG TPA: cysteine peptidase family C39 domain-containing protein [Candidatus Baltobacteraceae bacterium]|nr:cysteine peptidase family C39 domain-containing protein [Candidatus Baltobacteraceae bacterium]
MAIAQFLPATSPVRRNGRRRTAPFYFQNSRNDCAPACVLALCDYYGIDLTLADIRNRLNADPASGVKIADFSAALDEQFTVSIGRADASNPAAEIFPCIAYLAKDRHFVVLWGAERKDCIRIGDPAIGSYILNRDELTRVWDGIVVILRPRATALPHARQRRSAVSLMRSMVETNELRIAALMIMALVRGGLSTGFSIALPALITKSELVATVSGGVFLACALLGSASALLSADVRRRIVLTISQSIFAKMPDLDRRYYTVGDLTTRLQDAQMFGDAAIGILRDLPYVFVLLLSAFAFLLAVDVRLAVITLLSTIGILLAMNPLVRSAQALSYVIRLRSSRVTDLVKAFWMQDGTESVQDDWQHLQHDIYRQTKMSSPVSGIVGQLAPFTILLFALFHHQGGKGATAALLLMLVTLLGYFVSGISGLYGAYLQWIAAQPSASRIIDFLEHGR